MSNSREFYAYVAGVIDGEGCLELKPQKHPAHKFGSYLKAELSIANKERSMLEFIQKGIPNLQLVETKNRNEPFYYLRFRPNALRTYLPRIMPYLVVKRRQAELLLEALKLTKITHYQKGKHDDIYTRLREINDEIRNQHLGGKRINRA